MAQSSLSNSILPICNGRPSMRWLRSKDSRGFEPPFVTKMSRFVIIGTKVSAVLQLGDLGWPSAKCGAILEVPWPEMLSIRYRTCDRVVPT